MPVHYELNKDFVNEMEGYVAALANNFAITENALNELYAALAYSVTALAVPAGLQRIFDRAGLIGRASYDFSEGVLSAPDYNLVVAAGAYWDGSGVFASKLTATSLSLALKITGTYYLVLDTAGNPAVADTPGVMTVRQFDWDADTHTVAAKALYAGVAILFDGADYADCLDSAARSKSFTRLADRLEELEAMVAEMGSYYAQDHLSGLDFYYQAGRVRNDSVVYDTVAGHVTCVNAATNYVEVDPADGAVSINQAGFTSGQIPLFILVTTGGAITEVDDCRTWATTGGVAGGGHTQGTDTGTTASEFELDSDAAGSPAGRVGLKVNNGADPAASLKFNRDTGRWQYSVDDEATWRDLNDPEIDFGAQELTRYVSLAAPPLVLEDLGRSSSEDFESVDLSSFCPEAPQGVAAVVLRVAFWDAAPAEAVNVLLRQAGAESFSQLANTVWSGQLDPATIILPVDAAQAIEYLISASGVNTANLRIWLLGYYAQVTGVGTQDRSYEQAGMNVGAGATVDFNLTGFLNRGLAHYLKVAETGGVQTGTYDLHLYAKDTFLAADLLYKAEGIDPASDFEDWLPFWLRDADSSNELHLRLINNDGVNAGVFSVTLQCEQFA